MAFALKDIIKQPFPFWAEEVSQAAQNLGTDAEKGLQEKDVPERLSVFGANRFGEDKGPSVFAIFFRQFQSPLIIILLLASVATLVLNRWADASIIILAV